MVFHVVCEGFVGSCLARSFLYYIFSSFFVLAFIPFLIVTWWQMTAHVIAAHKRLHAWAHRHSYLGERGLAGSEDARH